MKRFSLKKVIACALAIAMVSTAFVGCSKSDSTKPKEKTKVTFWYLWSGDTVKVIDAMVKKYNAQSDKYEVEAVCTPDSQKIMTAISAGNGPDITDDFSNDTGKFASAGIMEPLDSYISKTKYDTSDFIPAALDSCKMDGKQYALPINVNFMALYYNKKILKDAGYTEPPKTMEEMYEMAVKTTKVNKDGSIDTLGFPDFPSVYYLSSFTAAGGGGWYTPDDKPAPADSQANALALKLATDYRKQFGLDQVVKFGSSGKYLDPTDPFLRGKQTFRIDGPWMGKNIKDIFKADIDYGVTYIPYPKDHPELAGRQNISSSMLYIPANAKNKDGAFDFLAYVAGKEGQMDFTVKGSGDFPSRLSLLETEEFKKSYDSDFYAELGKNKNLTTIPNGPKNSEYDTMVGEQTELCLNLKQSIETTLKNINKQGSEILK